ncbi:hypothetical protein BOW28_05400 [Solemya velum gill symbiont]|uniref:ribosome biogenesis factor YjgA n=1 Tax=Solemya velum gill symbiont TaxID=2340 RepID=UPI0009983B37|nr:ribosome biogenesis factor YjgA [Solemya velum gill symbiont]OOZ17609.1 hypothetical protein BOW28_05400 [Solemya velum gill symbiont]OOZ27247.1 hypothetical protein BOW32_04925 [Solemya velum gill symbiont]
MKQMNDEESMDFDEEGVEVKSKSQVKRELLALKDLGADLVTLSTSQLTRLLLPEHLFTAVKSAQTMKKGALKRQLQYIGKLLRKEDADQIISNLESMRQPHKEEVAHLHQLEAWRDALIDGDEELLQEIITSHAQVDRQHLRQLIRQAGKEKEKEQSPKSARLLFQYLKSLTENEA